MPSKPAALIPGLIHRNPVNPGLQRAVAPERSHVAEDLDKYILHYVGGIRGIVRQAAYQTENGMLIPLDKSLIGVLRRLGADPRSRADSSS